MCGIIGIFGHPEAAKLAYLGLYAQQHRGQESAGIVTSHENSLHSHQGMGLVADIFNQDSLKRLPGNHAIGHVRYSTHGGSRIENCQPFVVNYAHGVLAVAHNGNIVNASSIRSQFENDGAIFQSTMDTEVIVHLMAKSRLSDGISRVQHALQQIKGAFSLLFLDETQMIVARDTGGFRPLVIGQKDNAWVVASETCAFDLMGATFVREVAPGEIVVFDQNGPRSFGFDSPLQRCHHCVFEYVYFSRPDSKVFNRDVYEIRKGFGRVLASEHPVEADIVVPVPDSGVPSAIGYAQASGLPFELGLVRNHYVGRTFIEPEQHIRHFGVKIKLNPVRSTIAGKRVVLIDDSIVRGTTSQKIIKMVRDAGAREIHVRISSPPVAWPCFYGIDTPRRCDLIAAHKSVEEIRGFLGADSLAYLSGEGLYWFDKLDRREWFCDACFSGQYPVMVEDMKSHLK